MTSTYSQQIFESLKSKQGSDVETQDEVLSLSQHSFRPEFLTRHWTVIFNLRAEDSGHRKDYGSATCAKLETKIQLHLNEVYAFLVQRYQWVWCSSYSKKHYALSRKRLWLVIWSKIWNNWNDSSRQLEIDNQSLIIWYKLLLKSKRYYIDKENEERRFIQSRLYLRFRDKSCRYMNK